MAGGFDFWPLGLWDGEYLSEDVAFCRSWRRTGGDILVDMKLKLRHHGTFCYQGDPLQSVELVDAPAAA